MSYIKRILGSVGVILLLNAVINWIFVSKNDAKPYVDEYIGNSQQKKVKVNPDFFEEQLDYFTYFKGTYLYKGASGYGNIFMFKDNKSNKYFSIIRFDYYGEKYTHAQSTMLTDKELYVMVDPLQYNDSSYGTKENPILVFSYKGVNKELTYGSEGDKLINGKREIIDKSVEPSEEEYRYNVEQYLTYVMPKKEFKKRFK